MAEEEEAKIECVTVMQDAALPECPQFGVGGDRLYVMNCLLD
jgi:hypothetical protein